MAIIKANVEEAAIKRCIKNPFVVVKTRPAHHGCSKFNYIGVNLIGPHNRIF
jgi:hypothetical protein